MIYLGNRTLGNSRSTLALYRRRMQERLDANEPLYIEIAPRIGWRLQPSCRHPKWPYTTNAQGNRTAAPEGFSAAGACGVAIAGNSYVHCDEAPDDETWVWLLQQHLGRDFQIHNLGVTGYSTDQSFLRLEEFVQAQPVEIAVLTVTTTDIYRNLNMCRAFILNDFEVPLYKPRYVMRGDTIELKTPPGATLDTLLNCLDDPEVLAAFRAHDAFFPTVGRQAVQILRRFRVPLRDAWQRHFAEGLSMMERICEHFIGWCRERHITPVLLLLPVYWGGFPAGREFDLIRARFEGHVPVIDARQVFTLDRLRLPRAALAHRFNHFTPEVSGWLAAYIGDRIRQTAARAVEAA